MFREKQNRDNEPHSEDASAALNSSTWNTDSNLNRSNDPAGNNINRRDNSNQNFRANNNNHVRGIRDEHNQSSNSYNNAPKLWRPYVGVSQDANQENESWDWLSRDKLPVTEHVFFKDLPFNHQVGISHIANNPSNELSIFYVIPNDIIQDLLYENRQDSILRS